MFNLCNRAAFTITVAAPPAYPIIVDGDTTAKRKEQRANNISACKAWLLYMILHTIKHNQFAASINNLYYATLDDPTKGLNAVTLQQLVAHICTTYAQISQLDLDDNITNFNQGIKPNLPLAIYTRKQEKCQTFAQDAGMPNSKEMMVTTGTKHALYCGNMMLAWCERKHRPLHAHTWIKWKDHTAAFAEMRNINRMTSSNWPSPTRQLPKKSSRQRRWQCCLTTWKTRPFKRMTLLTSWLQQTSNRQKLSPI
jgi:hypothetical protein